MKRMSHGAGPALALTLVTLSLYVCGCRLPGGESPPTHYWLLESVDGAITHDEEVVLIGVGPFSLPDYLNRNELVMRVAGNELLIFEYDSWGIELQRGFKQVLARNLEVLVSGSLATVFPWTGPTQPHLQVAGVVTRFEVADDGFAHLGASWAITRMSDRTTLSRGSASLKESFEGESQSERVSALSRTLAALSREIAEQLSSVH
jgi:uncharacterized lipoprotein YmbA